MKRIVVVFNGDLSINRQGQLNSAICRIRHLKQLGTYDVDAYCVQEYSVGVLRLLRKEKLPEKKPFEIVDGIRINLIYKRCYFISALLETRMKVISFLSGLSYWRISRHFKHYDMVSGHSIIGGQVALSVFHRYGIPYSVTWHGSDIHTNPLLSEKRKAETLKIIRRASSNIFVSESLLNSAKQLFGSIPHPYVAYNAPGAEFIRYSDEKRLALRMKEKVYGKKVIAFVGNLVSIKNLFTLPVIFNKLETIIGNVAFWIVGDGVLRDSLEKRMIDTGIYCRFWGNIQPEYIPDLMNCIDVLVLPSKNESFGMVLVEAIACGANAVGSNRGGIPEVIGKENCFELDEEFVNKISERIVYMLKNKVEQTVNPLFDWNKTAEKESSIYSEVLGNNKSIINRK